MTDDGKQPWPGSWPPFWREVLHVALSTAVGNVALVLSALVIFGLSSSPDPMPLLAVVAAIAAGVLALAYAWLAGADRQSSTALIVALPIAAAAMVVLGWVAAMPYPSIFEWMVKYVRPATAVYILAFCVFGPSIASLGFGAGVLSFRQMDQRARGYRVWGAWLVGTALLPLATAWAYTAKSPVSARLQHMDVPPRLGIWLMLASSFVLFSLTFTIVARMLIGAVQNTGDGEAKAAGEE